MKMGGRARKGERTQPKRACLLHLAENKRRNLLEATSGTKCQVGYSKKTLANSALRQIEIELVRLKPADRLTRKNQPVLIRVTITPCTICVLVWTRLGFRALMLEFRSETGFLSTFTAQ